VVKLSLFQSELSITERIGQKVELLCEVASQAHSKHLVQTLNIGSSVISTTATLKVTHV